MSADQIRQWIREGRANGQTLVQAQDNPDWKPLGSIAEFSTEFAPPPPPPPPLVDDKASENATAGANRIATGDYTLSLRECLSKGWALFKAHAGLLVGASLIVLFIALVCNAIPLMGTIVYLVVSGPLFGGLTLLNLRLIRGEDVSIGDLFDGFDRCFSQLLMGQVVTGLFTTVSAFLFLAAYGVMTVFPSKIVALFAAPVACVGLLPAIYLTVCWIFTLPLIIDKSMEFWAAMELSRQKVSLHFWPVCVLVLGGVFIVAMGSFFFLVGALIAMPIFIATLTHAYEDIFNAR